VVPADDNGNGEGPAIGNNSSSGPTFSTQIVNDLTIQIQVNAKMTQIGLTPLIY
jgi:hypothetical protein